MIFTSFYTLQTPYEQVMQDYLLPTLKKFNLKYEIKGVKNEHHWQKNMINKSKLILEMLKKHKQDVIFIDADGTIEKFPQLFWDIPQEYDLAGHWLDYELQWREKSSKKRDLLGGTLMFRYRPNVLKFIEEWIVLCEKYYTTSNDQRLLQKLIKEHPEIKGYYLPYSYAVILTFQNKIPKHMIKPGEVVILHHQVSRKIKRLI